MEVRMRHTDPQPWTGFAAGLLAGLAATYLMTKFQNLSGKLALPEDEPRSPQHSAERGTPESAEEREGQGADATVRAAAAISRGLLGHELSEKEEKIAGPVMHYAFGALTGGVYGALAEVAPAVTRGAGAPFGLAVWLAADEITIPALRLAKPPWEHPPMVHARALAAHLVYGTAAEGFRRALRRIRIG
jgi:putative membrane protein